MSSLGASKNWDLKCDCHIVIMWLCVICSAVRPSRWSARWKLWGRARRTPLGHFHPEHEQEICYWIDTWQKEAYTSSEQSLSQFLWGTDYCIFGTQWCREDYHYVRSWALLQSLVPSPPLKIEGFIPSIFIPGPSLFIPGLSLVMCAVFPFYF